MTSYVGKTDEKMEERTDAVALGLNIKLCTLVTLDSTDLPFSPTYLFIGLHIPYRLFDIHALYFKSFSYCLFVCLYVL